MLLLDHWSRIIVVIPAAIVEMSWHYEFNQSINHYFILLTWLINLLLLPNNKCYYEVHGSVATRQERTDETDVSLDAGRR